MRISARSANALFELLNDMKRQGVPMSRDMQDAFRELKKSEWYSKRIQRRSGRPRHGQMSIRRARISELPDMVYMSDAARILGVSYDTIRRWTLDSGGPQPDRGRRGLFLYRDDLVRYLEETDRLGPDR